MRQVFFLATALVLSSVAVGAAVNTYSLTDARGPGRVLDGIGGLSGGGATSVFLWTFPEPQRSQILDYLFLPNFGASLHILKVEIGGDAQSTDGAEPSHMHNPWDENYERGYEWWLMTEAKRRNPSIKLYGLSWAYPQWVTCTPGTMLNCTNSIYTYPHVTATYITKWVSAAKVVYNLDIDYIGCWNERPYNDTYLKVLRASLDNAGFAKTKIVAPDGSWDIANDILKDPALAKAVYAIGAHYPGTTTTSAAEQTGKPLWASEDDSTYNNDIGAGCWARIINQNYVNGNMTASINWNLIAAYMKGTNWYRAGLMSAMQPWVGSYGTWRHDGSWTVGPMIWASAHTTQFSTPGNWSYLHHGDGAAHLANGGSYVTLKNFATGDFTIVIEKMSRDHSSCVRPYLPGYDTSSETAVIQLQGGLASVQSLHLWETHWAYYDGDTSSEFVNMGTVPVVGGKVTLNLTVNSLYTLTTVSTGHKGQYPIPQQPTLFPEAFTDDFENCRISGEGRYFTDQNGIWECVPSNDPTHGTVMRQMVPLRPVTWGGDIRPHSLIGHRDGMNHSLVVDAYIEEPGASVLLGLRMQGTDDSSGILWGIDTSSKWGLWSSVSAVTLPSPWSGSSAVPISAGRWFTYRMDVNGTLLNVWINGIAVVSNLDVSLFTASGHGLIGTFQYGQYTQFDNFQLYTSYKKCGKPIQTAAVGDAISVVECNSEVGLVPSSTWKFNAVPNAGKSNGTISLRGRPDLCIAAVQSATADPWWLQLASCNANDPLQSWSWTLDGIAPDSERVSFIFLPAFDRCLDIYQQRAHIGAAMDAWPCNAGGNQAFFFDYDAGEVGNEGTATCLGLC